ncbi:MAG: hypothetical protein ACJ75H_21450 [Thermoanaerobaculia bacterium]
MRSRRHVELVREGEFVAEVEVELTHQDEAWGPYLSVGDAEKLDDVREALRLGDLERASRLAKVYRLMPVAV